MTSDLRVLLVGAGGMGQAHAAAVRSCGSTVVAVVDPDQHRCSDLAAQYEAEPFATVGEALTRCPEIDACVIASPSNLHLEQSAEVARAGVPLLVEKPHRLPGQDPEPLRRLLRETGVTYQVGMTTRYLPGLAAIASAAHSGRLGQIALCTDCIWYHLLPGTLSPWYFSRSASGGGILLTNGVHSLDRIAWLLGGELRLQDASLKADLPGADCETLADVRLTGPADSVVTVSLLWSRFPVPASRLVLLGDKGSAVLHGDGSYRIVTGSQEEHGQPATPQSALVCQWQAFSSGERGPGLDDLEPTLAIIEAAYAQFGLQVPG
jgi:predicted dehydrogenase